jgi:hypothetical protein
VPIIVSRFDDETRITTARVAAERILNQFRDSIDREIQKIVHYPRRSWNISTDSSQGHRATQMAMTFAGPYQPRR